MDVEKDMATPTKPNGLARLKQFNPPRRRELEQSQAIDADSCSTTEELSGGSGDDEMEEDIELVIRDEARKWLSLHGTKLFSLESSKFLAKSPNPRGRPKGNSQL